MPENIACRRINFECRKGPKKCSSPRSSGLSTPEGSGRRPIKYRPIKSIKESQPAWDKALGVTFFDPSLSGGSAQKIALSVLHAHRPQQIQIFLLFNPLRHDLRAQGVGHF